MFALFLVVFNARYLSLWYNINNQRLFGATQQKKHCLCHGLWYSGSVISLALLSVSLVSGSFLFWVLFWLYNLMSMTSPSFSSVKLFLVDLLYLALCMAPFALREHIYIYIYNSALKTAERQPTCHWSAPSSNTVLWYGVHTWEKTLTVSKVFITMLPASSNRTTDQDTQAVLLPCSLLRDLELSLWLKEENIKVGR